MRVFLRIVLGTAILAMLSSLPLRAADFPSRSLRLVVPYPAGGVVDVVGRKVAAKVSEQLGQPIVVDNKVGAAGRIGTEAVATAAADGHTLLLATAPIAIFPSIYENLGWDPERSFEPVAFIGNIPSVIVVAAENPAKTLADFVAAAKAKPNSLNAGSAGVGTITHLAVKLLEQMADISLVDVPFNGLPPALLALYRGDVHVMALAVTLAKAPMEAGKLRALAVTSKHRSSVLPDVPSVAESGYPTFDTSTWYGIMAPAGTPSDVVRRLNNEFAKALKDPELRASLRGVGLEADPSIDSPQAFRKLVAAERVLWADVVKRAGIKKQ